MQNLCGRLHTNAANIAVHTVSRKVFTFIFVLETHSKGLSMAERHFACPVYYYTVCTASALFLNAHSIFNVLGLR